MCGIAGVFAHSNNAPPVSAAELLSIRDTMETRGPDAAGLWLSDDGRVGLAHRRLAIIDLSDDGIQPMHSDAGLSISYNGEIYNYRELRTELAALGHVFTTQSDTEVVLHAYRQWGCDMFDRLRGMYAFGLWDHANRELILARDPYGIKPLYYSNIGGTLRFASWSKALWQCGDASLHVDNRALASFYLTGSVMEPFTAYREISALPSGTYLKVTERGLQEPVKHVSIAEIIAQADVAAREFQPRPDDREMVIDAIRESLRYHMVADVPVAVFLSSGLDSSALLGMAVDAAATPPTALTLGFDEYAGRDDDETPLAERTAAYYGAPIKKRVVGAEEFQQDLDSYIAKMSPPSIDGVNSWYISKFAKEQGFRAALSGLGGDELFGTYPAFRDIPRWNRQLRPLGYVSALRTVAVGAATRLGLGRLGVPAKAMGLLGYGDSMAGAWFVRRGLFMPWELPKLMGRDQAREGLDGLNLFDRISGAIDPRTRSDFARIASLEAGLYMRHQLLRDSDWTSMAHSLEVRVPMVDHMLLRKVAPAIFARQVGPGKTILADTPKKRIPDFITHRQKTGFSIPLGRWLGLASHGSPKNPYDYMRSWATFVGRRFFDG